MKQTNGATFASANDQFFVSIAVEADPGNTRPELAELLHEQRLPCIIVEQDLMMFVPEEIAALAKHRFDLGRLDLGNVVCLTLIDFVDAVWRCCRNFTALTAAPSDFDRNL